MNYSSNTNIGVFRKENQDDLIILENSEVTFASVCDGMGGHPGGKIASKLIINAFKKLFKKSPPNKHEDAREWIEKCYLLSRKLMEKESKYDSKLLDMGTTTASILVYEKISLIFNVGDSRVYAFNNTLHQITDDHNLMNYYIQHQGMSVSKARNITGGSALTSALGPTKDIRVSSYQVDNDSIKYFILTSDGIHDFIRKPLFELILSNKDTELHDITNRLIKESLKAGSKDNLTVIILEMK